MNKTKSTSTAGAQKQTAANQHNSFFNQQEDSFFNKNQEQKDSFFGSGVQAKLRVGRPNDSYEKEADTVADKVVQNLGTDNAHAENISAVSAGSMQQLPLQREGEEQTDQEMGVEEDTLQRKPIFESASDENGVLQSSSDQAPSSAGSHLEAQLSASKGGGSSMDDNTKSSMESGFGSDFSDVRVHTDNQAVQMNQQLGAKAFTHGNDIYFNEGQYNPGSTSGQHLLAHELTHTVQQGGGDVKRSVTQQPPQPPSPPAGVTPISNTASEFSYSEGNYVTVLENGNTLRLPFINLPQFKARNSSKFTPPYAIPSGRNTNQRENWRQAVDSASNRHLETLKSEARVSGGTNRTTDEASRIYFFKGKRNPNFTLFATSTELLEHIKIPIWDDENRATSFQVDHIVEHQLGGSDDAQNYELLEAGANSSSGSSIAWEMNRRIKSAFDVLNSPFYQNASATARPNLPARPARANQYVNAFSSYNVEFLAEGFDLQTNGMHDRFWSFNQIQQGEHVNKIEPLTGDEVRELGTEDDPALFLSQNGGERMQIPEGDNYPVNNWITRVDLLERPDFAQGQMRVSAYKARDLTRRTVTASYDNMTWYLNQIPNSYIFYVDKQRTIDNAVTGTTGVFQSLRVPGMSPIRIDTLELNENGFYGQGKVLPTVPLISDADIDIIIDGDSIRLRKLFDVSEFSFPAPFEVKAASLEVSFGTDGLGMSGDVEFGITNVGEGRIQASVSSEGGFGLEGSFNFDSSLFDPAEINVSYIDNIWTIGGTIGIPEGKIRGIKSATITASYSENNFTATGEAELDVPGVEQGTMTVNYGEEGFSMEGTFNLSSDVPGIRGGSVSARVAKEQGAEDYSVMVSGTAQPDIPGINSTLTVTYEDGALDITGSATYQRGMLSGSVNVGATNRAIGDDGEPTGDPDDTMRVYGGGSLTLTLTPWLAATAGVQFLPNGEIEVTGRIGLPDTVDVFARQSFDRTLFNMPAVEIPIFAIPLGPRSLGLVARITGGLDFSAGFGPGQLRELFAEVTYNPDREDETTIHGRGVFAIPADAGLTLRGDLGLGVSVGIASLTGGIEVAGSLGLEGEASASVDVNWSPATGLQLDAEGRITVNPKFQFDINAFARASLDLWLVSISETWRHNLASFSWGPDIQFGLVFPVHYREGEPFNLSFDDIEVIYPDLDVIDMVGDLARDIKDDIFD